MARYVHFDVRTSRRSRKQIQPISSEKIEICLVRFKSISSREHIHYFRKPAWIQGFDKDGSKKPVKSRLCGQQQAMRQLKLNKFTEQGYRFHQWYPFSVAPHGRHRYKNLWRFLLWKRNPQKSAKHLPPFGRPLALWNSALRQSLVWHQVPTQVISVV